MKKRVAVITLDGLYNFGNRLQNLAVQRIYERAGCECETLICMRSPIHALYRTMLSFKDNFTRTLAFLHFNRKYIKIRRICRRKGQVPQRIAAQYDLFSVGSDQVWNPFVRRRDKHVFYLQFAPRNKRVSLAASIAVDEVPDEYRKSFTEGISGFNRISVREKQGQEIIRELTGKESEVLVDPTLALTAQEWTDMLGLKDADGDGYVLLYFLGDVTDDFMSRVNAFAREKGLKIVSAFIKNGTATRNDYDPADFVGLVRNAGYVFTDSFHGVAFSIIFNRTFWAFQRAQPGASMKSRIVSILDRLGLEDRLCAAFPEKAADIDYTAANDILESERAKFACFVNDIVQNGISD